MQIEKKQPEKKQPEISSKQVLGKWLRIFSLQFGKEITAENAAIYSQALCGIPPDELERCCQESFTAATYGRVPTVPDILSHVSKREQLQLSDRCLVEWEAILQYAKHWNSDIGWRGYMGRQIPKPQVSAQAEYALRHIGGWIGLAQCAWDDHQLVFKKRDFEGSYGRYSEMEKSGYKPLSQAEARKLLGMTPKRQIAEKSE